MKAVRNPWCTRTLEARCVGKPCVVSGTRAKSRSGFDLSIDETFASPRRKSVESDLSVHHG